MASSAKKEFAILARADTEIVRYRMKKGDKASADTPKLQILLESV